MITKEKRALLPTLVYFFVAAMIATLDFKNGALGLNAVEAAAYGSTVNVPIGRVRFVAGEITIARTKGTVALKIGDSIYADEEIGAATGGNLGVELLDGTLLALGENSRLVVHEFVYNPKTRNGTAVIWLVYGSAELISGTIARSGRDHMIFKTPVATIGVLDAKVF